MDLLKTLFPAAREREREKLTVRT